MALTQFQRDICGLLADRRKAAGESYVAGGVALSVALDTFRLSRDLDLFHDSIDAVARSWDRDRSQLVESGYGVKTQRERPGFVQASVSRGPDSLIVEWIRDSAFRFFPLLEHPLLGLTLHPFDLATNKVLALVGRLEVRDWVDVLACDERLQPLGYLAWSACGKDPGFSPPALLGHAVRSGRYSEEEVASLAFDGPPPRAADLSRRWHAAVEDARTIVERLPVAHVGEVVLTSDARLFTGGPAELAGALKDGAVRFHRGRLLGALPTVRVAGSADQ